MIDTQGKSPRDVLLGLECCMQGPEDNRACHDLGCPYLDGQDEFCIDRLMRHAHAMLAANIRNFPLTVEEVELWANTDVQDRDPLLEEKRRDGKSEFSWVRIWPDATVRRVQAGKSRCWRCRPTEEELEAIPWTSS